MSISLYGRTHDSTYPRRGIVTSRALRNSKRGPLDNSQLLLTRCRWRNNTPSHNSLCLETHEMLGTVQDDMNINERSLSAHIIGQVVWRFWRSWAGCERARSRLAITPEPPLRKTWGLAAMGGKACKSNTEATIVATLKPNMSTRRERHSNNR